MDDSAPTTMKGLGRRDIIDVQKFYLFARDERTKARHLCRMLEQIVFRLGSVFLIFVLK